MNSPHLSMSRYRNSRNWAVYNGPELPAVTVYRKGAEAIINLFNDIISNNTHNDHEQGQQDRQEGHHRSSNAQERART